MKIEVLGTGCAKCNKLYEAAKEAVSQAGIQAEVTHVTDLAELMKRGVMVTPALAVDGAIKIAGKVPKPAELAKLLV
ncbi:MAG: thioredoxin family protein [Deferrisomatales bacterium]|nr:thioredoxin family protein [Deferrisomatales bacterium]HSH71370.1 thioredoxin family protein [Deferrisomatales bacterium]